MNDQRSGNNFAISAGGQGFDSRAGQIGHSVATAKSLRYFFGAVLPRRQALSRRDGSRHSLHASA